MSVKLIEMPKDVLGSIKSFLPTAGVLTRNINKSFGASFGKNTQSWTDAAKQYGFKILDSKNAKQEFITQYNLLKKTNQVLLERCPFLTCKNKDPLHLNRELQQEVMQLKCRDNLNEVFAKLLQDYLNQKDDAEPMAKALMLILENHKTMQCFPKIWAELIDKHSGFLPIFIERCVIDNRKCNWALCCAIFNSKLDAVKEIMTKLNYKPSLEHFRIAVMVIKVAEPGVKDAAKDILKAMFDNASKTERKEINATIKHQKEINCSGEIVKVLKDSILSQFSLTLGFQFIRA